MILKDDQLDYKLYSGLDGLEIDEIGRFPAIVIISALFHYFLNIDLQRDMALIFV